ncbi:ADP-ribosyltransferase domain-containing protein [Jiangella asiatica]|nr:ADP-ribosyltransferase domain-containing protein [Jiangella asiatica]
MKRSAGTGRPGSVRSSVDALTRLSEATCDEFDRLSRGIRADVARIAGVIGAAPAGPLVHDAALRQLGTELARLVDGARDQVGAAIGAEIGALAALLGPAGVAVAGTAPTTDVAPSARTATAEAPPLPELDDIAAPKGTRQWAEAVAERYPRLTADEVLAIHAYTTVRGVDRINGHLRAPEQTPAADRDEIETLAAHAVAGLTALPASPGVTFRGTGLPDHVLARWERGSVVADPAFLSSSANRAVAESFRGGRNALITIVGRTGVDVRKLSQFGHESEILFRPDTPFRVLSRRWDHTVGCWRIRVEEITA